MLRIALFTPTMESVILLAPIYKHMIEEGYTPLFYDVVEEGGWFEKGVQFLSLGYSRPRKILRFKSYNELYSMLDRIVEKENLDIAVLAGYSKATYHILNRFLLYRIRTLHMESGLRSYMEHGDEALRQAVDWRSIYNLTPSKIHYQNLVNEGFPRDQIYISGSTYVDNVFINLSEALTKSMILDELNISRNTYIYSYLSSDKISSYIDGIGEASIKWDIDIVLPLKTKLKNLLKNVGQYYNLMTKYYMIPIEQVDYLDHLNLIYNTKYVITDDYRVALESALLKKNVIILDRDRDLYRLGKLSTVRYIEYNKLSNYPLSELSTKPQRDISHIYGGGESRIYAVKAIKGYSNSGYSIPEWKGLYIKGSEGLSVIEGYRSGIP